MHHLGVAPARSTRVSAVSGVKRRQEVRGIENGITVIDDFAHHPTAVRETLAGLKEAYDGQRLIAVFEPRTNSSRRAIFQKDYVAAFDAADARCCCGNRCRSRVLPRGTVFFGATCRRSEKRAGFAGSNPSPPPMPFWQVCNLVLREGDVVAILSNGGFDNIHARLLEQIKARPHAG